MNDSIGCILRRWRKKRRYSQLQLALELAISSKHVSFIETGRSLPSREMILKIGEFLFLPKREINRGLYSAGYAPVYTELSVGHERLKPVFSAINQMIRNHMPYPALVLNQDWDVVQANATAERLLVDLGYSGHKNLVEALTCDNPQTSKIVNWHESALAVLMRLRHEINMLGGSRRLEELEKNLTACLAPEDEVINIDETAPILATKIKTNGYVLSFFSIISHLSTIQDVTVGEFKVELMFPADEITQNFYRQNI